MDNLQALEVMKIVLGNFRTLRKADREYMLGKLQSEHDKLGEKVDNPTCILENQYKSEVRSGTNPNRIWYIKEVRNATGMGLKEAKDLVDSW